MFFKFERKKNMLDVSDNFATLVSISQHGDMEFELSCGVSQMAAVQSRALLVRVTVSSRTVPRKRLFGESGPGNINVPNLVQNILTQVSDAKSAAKQQKQFTVAAKNIDVTSKINNEISAQLRAKAPASSIQQLKKSVLKLVPAGELKENNDSKPVLQSMSASPRSIDIDLASQATGSFGTLRPSELMYDMIVRQGIDPSIVTSMTHRSVPAVDNLGGTLKPVRVPEVSYDPASELLDSYVLAPDEGRQQTTNQERDNSLVHVLVSETIERLDLPTSITIPGYSRIVDGTDNSRYFVAFELLNDKGLAVDQVTKVLDVAQHVQLFNTPKKPPIIRVARSEISSRVNLEIKQVDPVAIAVQVFKKTISRAVPDQSNYVLVGSYDVSNSSQSLLVQVDMPKSSTAVYRVIPLGPSGARGFEYTNVVVKPDKFQQLKSVALVARASNIGVQLELSQIPLHVVSVEFLAKNLTIHESDFRNVGGTIYLVDEPARAADHVTTVDRDAIPNNVYSYVVKLYYDTGLTELAGSEVVEFVQPDAGRVDTKIDNLVVSQNDQPNVTFTVTTNVVDGRLDIIKTLLQRQDIYDLFKDDVEKEREFLKSLIAHNIQRVDLSTGKRENFGVVTSGAFSDQDLRKNQSIDPLMLGHKYRYEITALLREPETVFESLLKESFDPTTKKAYLFSPAKFRHPLALTRGLLVTSQGLKTRHAKDIMMHGALGSAQIVEVSFDKDAVRVVDPAAARFNNSLNVITWQVQGSVDQIDHFIVMKEVNGNRTVIGKSHADFLHGNCQHIHPITARDSGALTYVIIPVLSNYRVGSSTVTNQVVI